MKIQALILCLSLLVACAFASPARAETVAGVVAVPLNVAPLLEKYCFKCHKGEDAEGDVRLNTVASLEKGPFLDVLNKAESQLFFGMMPPEDARQPSAEERQSLFAWVRGELRKNNASALDLKARSPDAGNWVDHRSLFNGSVKEKPFSPARRWLVSPQIFQERVFELFNLNSKEREFFKRGIFGLETPFTLPDHSGVRSYDTAALEGGNLFAMMKNAKWISDKELGSIQISHGAKVEDIFADKRDRFYPWKDLIKAKKPVTPVTPAFQTFLSKSTPLTDEEIIAGIQLQFDRVLQRPANDVEVKKYLDLTRGAIGLVGNAEGLRQMLQAVLLESEFVYRIELGTGAPDQYGRKMLSPREAGYAIAYALGDRGPDPALAAAMREGRLNTKQDYEREVRRLLADENYFKGIIDPVLSTNSYEPHVAAHPKTLRFFREFFGYPAAVKVFKDNNRSNGYYSVPGRDSLGTPGTLVKEADLFVERILLQDKDVFANLLGSDLFFVAPIKDAAAVMDGLNEVYERFKDTDWRGDPKAKIAPAQLSAEDLVFVRKRLTYNANEATLTIAMRHIERFKKQGLKYAHPYWNYPFADYKDTPALGPFATPLTLWANSYNINPFKWDYPREQPFQVAHRKGILTHPAWLIAHSANTATDPVRRGRWIREKLLAGTVPPVPITVDAKIPEDPHKTLGDRLKMVTNKEECWKCHVRMNPLGIPFEMFDDFGRFRTEEILEYPENLLVKATQKGATDTYKTAPFQTAGSITGTGEPAVDGEVKDALDLIGRLAKSERVRQSIIRHAFRFYMGRNEMLSDSPTLIEADRAYVKSGGSFNEVIVSLLTSDSFIYRK